MSDEWTQPEIDHGTKVTIETPDGRLFQSTVGDVIACWHFGEEVKLTEIEISVRVEFEE